ncbi:MAG: tetraacyldisaccharide 4'-kinase [Xanthobacteraceae bacterium]
MREPAFWRSNGLLARLLTPAAAVYSAVADMRMYRDGRHTTVPVLCVGSATVGGAGKTPAAIALATLLQAYGETPVFLTRGYGGKLAGPVRVLPSHGAKEVGDEALLLAKVAPTIVARNRVTGATLAAAEGATVIVMDDGFQNPSLHKDYSLLVVDGERGSGNGRVFPAGPLRASLQTQIRRAEGILIIGRMGLDAHAMKLRAAARGLPVFTARILPDMTMVPRLRGYSALAFSGIAFPDKFFATLKANGINIAHARSFPDHHRFSEAEAADLINTAAAENLILVTTEKDMARMRGDPALATLARSSNALPVTLAFDDEGGVRRDLIESLVGRKQRS